MSQDNPPTPPGGLAALLAPLASLLLGLFAPVDPGPVAGWGERVKAAAFLGAAVLAVFSVCLVAVGFLLAFLLAASVGIRT